MSDHSLDFSLKTALRSGGKGSPRASLDTCPLDGTLADYVSETSSTAAEKDAVAAHVAKCDKCFEKVALCVAALSKPSTSKESDTRKGLLRKALSMPKKYPRIQAKDSYMKRNKYIFISGVFFLLSFVFKLFFIQFLAAALIFGLKWIMDAGSTKALIMIYETWKSNKNTEDDINDKDTINHRRL